MQKIRSVLLLLASNIRSVLSMHVSSQHVVSAMSTRNLIAIYDDNVNLR